MMALEFQPSETETDSADEKASSEPFPAAQQSLASIVEAAEKDLPCKVIDGQWMRPARAARTLAVSVSTIMRMIDTGKLTARVDQRGWREIMVTGAAVREFLAYRRKRDADALLIDVVRLAEQEGKSVTEIVLDLECPSYVVAKTLLAHHEAIKTHRQITLQRFATELETGDVNMPTTWAWVSGCFHRKLIHRQALDLFNDWIKRIGGESNADISPLVRRVLSSEVRWNAARIAWDRHDCHEVARYQAEQARLRGLDTEVSVKEAEKKSLQVEKDLQTIRHQEQREADRHQRDADLRNEREEKKNRMSKVKVPMMPTSPFDGSISMADPNGNEE